MVQAATQSSGYTVRQGDTLSAIAARNGTDWQTLARINGLSNPNLIHSGQRLSLVASATGNHTVARGDTLGAIAARHGTDAATLAHMNGIANPNLIYPGQVLRIPTSQPAPVNDTTVRPTRPTGNATGGVPQSNRASVAAAEYARSHVLSGSSGYCYRYVKQALQATGAVPDYIPGVAAKDAGPALEQRGFVNIVGRPGVSSPYDAPVGAVIVYGPAPGATDRNARYGHIEIRTRDGFASDYFSPTARTGAEAAGMAGRGRVVTGIYVKPDPNAASVSPSPTGENRLAPGNLSLGINAGYTAAIREASQRTGIAPQAVAAIINAEAAKDRSGRWQADSRSSMSSATGLTQFLSGTWLGEARRAGSLLNQEARALGLVDANNRVTSESRLLALRTDPRLSILAGADFARTNLAALQRAGVMPAGASPGAIAKYAYLAHHEGAGGAIRFLRGDMAYVPRSTFDANVPRSEQASYLRQAGGDMGQAYRNWLSDYMDRSIDIRRFMADPAGISVPTTRSLGQ